ncbi:MAG: DUF1549 and DUF1553 domain-containing protein [Planctomycetota bacterium]
MVAARPSLRLLGLASLLAAPLLAQDGAEPGHWAFRAPDASLGSPAVRDSEWCREPVDAFVLARLEAEGLGPSAEADPRTLLRRLHLDLTGLPPTPGEVRAFVADPSETAYRAVVEDLLARPAFGEHFARPWLDVVRLADTNGIHHDHFREVSPYRDWVIRALNDNLPYDQFVVDQVAGDLHPEPTQDQLVASGFHRLHRIIDVGTALPEESYTNNVIDRVTAYSTAFLGLTAHCAVCHDHKSDPLKQREFYGLFAFFNNLDGAPETGGRSGTDFRRGLQPPYVELPSADQAAALEKAEAAWAVVDAEVRALEAMPEADRAVDHAQRLDTKRKDRLRLAGERDAIRMAIPAALVMRERAEPRPAFLLRRGDYQLPGDQVPRGTPAFLPPLDDGGDSIPSRMDLARWTVRPEHPLTARVAVNRVWQTLFGTGLVKTQEDFGVAGEAPSHPALLDHLAVRFVQSGWDTKQLIRSIVLSSTYRQSSDATTERFRADPENRLLARGSRFRLDAEVIRDQILAVTGLLDRTMFGPSIKVPQPPRLWEAVALPDSYPRVHVADPGAARYRRSVYTFWKRGLPPPQMTILDAPSREACVARRERTNTPLQALLLLNEPEYLAAARHLAERSLATPLDEGARIDLLYETVTAHLPTPAARAALLAALGDLRTHYAARTDAARAVCDDAGLDADTAALRAAWTLTVSTLLNLDATRSRS